MSAASIQFTVGADTSKGIANLKNFESVAKDTGKQIQEAFGRKLNQIVTFTAIEEAVRRTGEWAQQIQQTSKALGITAEQTQALQIAASKLGLNPDTTVNMFQNMEQAAQGALEGNQELLRSFNKLGITMDDLRGKHGDLWRKLTSNPELQGVVNSPDMFLRNSAQNIFKTPEQDIAAIVNNKEGANLEAAGTVSNEDTAALSQQWAEFKTDLAELGNSLKPLAGIFITLADAVVKATHALVDIVSGLNNIWKGGWHAISGGLGGLQGKNWKAVEGLAMGMQGLKKIFGVGAGTIFGLSKGMAGIGDFATGGAFGISERLKKSNDSLINGPLANYIDPTTEKHGEGLGEIAPALLSEGGSALLRGAGTKMFNLGSKFEGMGLTDMGLQKAGLWTDVQGYKLSNYLKGKSVLNGQAVSDMKAAGDLQKILDDPAIASSLTAEQKAASIARLQELKTRIARNASRQLAMLKVIGPAGALLSGGSAYGNSIITKGKEALEGTQIYNPFAPQYAMNAIGAGKNVNIGGMFGTGTNQIIRLNQKMVELLTLIQYNTSPTMIGGRGNLDLTGGVMGGNGNAAGN